MEKVLRINVGAENGPVATIEELGAYAGLGGRAMTTTVVCNEVPPNCHPLGPENKLVFSPGLMAGSAAASSGRISVGCKSPLTGTIKESNSGGTGGQFMARLGYAAIIIEGERKTDDLWKIVITKDAVTFEKCNEYRMFSQLSSSCRPSGKIWHGTRICDHRDCRGNAHVQFHHLLYRS